MGRAGLAATGPLPGSWACSAGDSDWQGRPWPAPPLESGTEEANEGRGGEGAIGRKTRKGREGLRQANEGRGGEGAIGAAQAPSRGMRGKIAGQCRFSRRPSSKNQTKLSHKANR